MIKKIFDFLYFSRVVGYILTVEMFLAGMFSVAGLYYEKMGEFLVRTFIYSYIFVLPQNIQKIFFKSCEGFDCLLPQISAWGKIYNIVVILGILYLVACILQFSWEFLISFRKRGIILKSN